MSVFPLQLLFSLNCLVGNLNFYTEKARCTLDGQVVYKRAVSGTWVHISLRPHLKCSCFRGCELRSLSLHFTLRKQFKRYLIAHMLHFLLEYWVKDINNIFQEQRLDLNSTAFTPDQRWSGQPHLTQVQESGMCAYVCAVVGVWGSVCVWSWVYVSV